MKKIILIWMFLVSAIILTGCNFNNLFEDNGSNSPDVPVCESDEYLEDGICHPNPIIYATHAEFLKDVGKEIYFNNLEYRQSDENRTNIDYSDDTRELWDVNSYQDSDVIVFPDEAFNELIRKELGLPEGEDITFGALQTITEIESYNHNIYEIKSIAGIELIQNVDSLILDANRNLGSINGIQNLNNLSYLNLIETGIRYIDYNVESLEILKLSETKINFHSTSELLENIDGYENLKSLNVNRNEITLDDIGAIERKFSNVEGALIRFDFSDIDFTKVNLGDITLMFMIDNKLLIDESNPTFQSEYVQGLNEVYDSIGVTEDMSELKKITLIYDYVYEDFNGRINENDGFTTLDKVFNQGYSPTSETMPHILNALLNKAGIDSEIQNQYYQIGRLDTKKVFFNDGFKVVNVELENGEKYIIDINYALEKGEMGLSQEYDRFLIGYETMTQSMYNEYLAGKGISPQDEFILAIESNNRTLNPGDVAREDIINELPEGMEADYSPDLEMGAE